MALIVFTFIAILVFIILPFFIFSMAKKKIEKFTSTPFLINGLSVFVVVFIYSILIFDQYPFYWYAKHLYSKDGGVITAKTDPDAEGFLTRGNCEVRHLNPKSHHFSSMCYFMLYESPSRKRALKFIEFEIMPDEAKNPSPFYERQGPGIYRITMEKKSFEECRIMKDLAEKLSKIDPKYLERDFYADIELLNFSRKMAICPFVRKVDKAASKYREESAGDSKIIFNDGIHRITRYDSRMWPTIEGKDELYRSVGYCVEGAFILWGNQSDVWPPILCTKSKDPRSKMQWTDFGYVFNLKNTPSN